MNWQDAFLDQAQSCASLGSPFTARLLTLLAERGLPQGPVLDRITGWPGDITSRAASLPRASCGTRPRTGQPAMQIDGPKAPIPFR